MKKPKSYNLAGSLFLSVIFILSPLRMKAQDTESTNYDRDRLITAAKEIMEITRYCALITLDSSGQPQVRTMDPFLPDDQMVVWLGTNITSRKVHDIRHDPRVSLYYEAPQGGGYVVIQGDAYLIDDPENKEKYWKEAWDAFYPDRQSTYTLIKVIPKKLEIISYQHGITSSSNTWAVPHVEF
jgi:general stress protein 26